MSILNQPEISEAYFFPQDVRCEDVIEVNVGAAVLRCHHYIGNQDGRTLVHFHGNGEAVGHYTEDDFPAMLSSRMNGINVLMVEYRGYGGSTGEVEMASMLPDGKNIIEQLEIDPAKTIAYGRSIGSLYAIELAFRCPALAGLVIDSGIADIRERFLARKDIAGAIENWDAVENEIAMHFNHQTKIGDFKGDLLLLHAARDGLIEMSHADRLYEWATGARRRTYTGYLEGNHNTIFPVNHESMLGHLRCLEQDLFQESAAEDRSIFERVVPRRRGFDRGAMLDREKEDQEPVGESDAAKPKLFSKLRQLFSRN